MVLADRVLRGVRGRAWAASAIPLKSYGLGTPPLLPEARRDIEITLQSGLEVTLAPPDVPSRLPAPVPKAAQVSQKSPCRSQEVPGSKVSQRSRFETQEPAQIAKEETPAPRKVCPDSAKPRMPQHVRLEPRPRRTTDVPRRPIKTAAPAPKAALAACRMKLGGADTRLRLSACPTRHATLTAAPRIGFRAQNADGSERRSRRRFPGSRQNR